MNRMSSGSRRMNPTITVALAHSLTHSLAHSLAHSLTHSFCASLCSDNKACSVCASGVCSSVRNTHSEHSTQSECARLLARCTTREGRVSTGPNHSGAVSHDPLSSSALTHSLTHSLTRSLSHSLTCCATTRARLCTTVAQLRRMFPSV
jgi:hypothetical protein